MEQKMKEMENEPLSQHQPQINPRGGFSGPRRVGQAAPAVKGRILFSICMFKVL